MRSFLKTFAPLCVAAALFGAGYVAWYLTSPVQPASLPVDFEIPRGASLRAAIDRIESAGVPLGKRRFEATVRLLGRDLDIKAGSYELTVPLDRLELLDKLTRGEVVQSQVQLIEGLTFTQLRAALDSHPDLKHDTINLGEGQILRWIGAKEEHAEGLLFPDTYVFARGSSDLAVLRRAYRSMQQRLEEQWAGRAEGLPYRSPYEALIMASIIEKETGQAVDRDRIGGVLVNRLRRGMRLQVDPTVIYGLGDEFNGNLKKVHLLTDGPYNTYTRAGLPPTPIAMPGQASLHAALHPAQTDALYYVSRGDGSSEFSRSLQEHNRAVQKYQLPAGRRK